ncbi:hypothetical protein K2X83_00545 [Patescibacteria group bacterium]|nr:hypothetical protein [Patescibacteria group bacterium]
MFETKLFHPDRAWNADLNDPNANDALKACSFTAFKFLMQEYELNKDKAGDQWGRGERLLNALFGTVRDNLARRESTPWTRARINDN